MIACLPIEHSPRGIALPPFPVDESLLEEKAWMQSRVKKLEAPGVARIFMDSARRHLLLSFVTRTRTVGEVAAADGLSIGSAHYLVADFVRQGLLRVEREEKRAGRPIKHYRAVASSFFLPLEFVSGSPGGGLGAEMRGRLDEELALSEDEGLLFYVDDDGRARVSWFGDRKRRRPVAEFWQILKLKDADALSLIADLQSLLERYQQRSGEGRTFLIHAAVAPRRAR
jgi:hypothetical protein